MTREHLRVDPVCVAMDLNGNGNTTAAALPIAFSGLVAAR